MILQDIPKALTKWYRSENVRIGGVLLLTAFILSMLFSFAFSELVASNNFKRDQVATHTVRAPRDFHVEETNIEKAQRRMKALAQVERVFSISFRDQRTYTAEIDSILSLYSDLKTRSGSPEQLRREFETRTGINISGDEWDIIDDPANWVELAEKVIQFAQPILKEGVIINKRPLVNILANGGRAVLRDPLTNRERELESPTQLYNLREAVALIETSIPTSGSSKGRAFNSLVVKLARTILKPNVSFDSAETDLRLKQAESSVEHFFYQVRRGEVIVRAGDKVSAEQERRLHQLQQLELGDNYFRSIMGYFLLSSLVFFSILAFCRLSWPQRKATTVDMSLICLTLVCSFILVKVFSFVGASLSSSFYYVDPGTFALATPLAVGGILLQVTLGAPAVFFFVFCFTLLSTVFLDNALMTILLIAVGNIVAAVSVRRCSRRSVFVWAGIRIAAVNVLVVSCFFLVQSDYRMAEMMSRLFWTIIGGVFSGVIGAGLIPIAEFFGRYVTDIKLLELASLDHPLLRELSVGTPGTWNHSTVIGQMSESAAESCGANPLLVRVGAYYHDIGKTKKPAYFVENQTGENRHDKLTPSMSALIIKAHVKDGVEMAKHHRLPQSIIDFISQHHGTSLIEFFYDKAIKEAVDGEDVEESHYRYPGPKPQSKEAGILMLADAVEASSRTLSDPSPAKVQGLVQKMINKIFASGELDESNLTLKDLHLIAKSFTRVLTGIYHRRVEYSESAEKGKDSKDKKESKSSKDAKASKDGKVGKHGKANKDGKSRGEVEPSKEPKSKDEKGSDSTGTIRLVGDAEKKGKDKENGKSEDTLKRLGI